MRTKLITVILQLMLATTLMSCRQSTQQKAQREAKELDSIEKMVQARDSILLDSIKKDTFNPPERTDGQTQYGKQR